MQDESTQRRAVGYLRVSTSLQAEQGEGLGVQGDRVRECAASQGLELVEVIEESASGGVSDGEVFSWEHRPVLLELIDRAKQGAYDVLLVARLDRLSRDHPTLVVLERELQRHGVDVISAAEESNGDGPLAEFVRGQLGLVAQLERAMIRERLAAGKARRRAEGRHVHGRAPYGYTSKRGVLEPVDELAPIVRQIFTRARDGDTAGKIARALNREQVPAPQGATWSANGVTVILRNPAYAGERSGVKKAHMGIVSRRLWNQAQQRLDARSRPRA